MDVCIEGEYIGKMILEVQLSPLLSGYRPLNYTPLLMQLYKQLCPVTCNNFVALCTGEKGVSPSGVKLSYINSLFHRIVKGGWIQGGGGSDILKM